MSIYSQPLIDILILFACLTKVAHCYKLLSNLDIHRDRSMLVDVNNHIWKNGIVPYKFHRTFDDWGRSEVRTAMDVIENVSCIKFVPTDSNSNFKDYVLISEGSGCSSEIGKVGGKQDLYLDTPYCLDRGTILHELLHTLGMIHEHSRPDRDHYVNINWSNIDSKHKTNFEIFSIVPEDYYTDQPYDFESIMHYSSDSRAINKKIPVIKPKDGSISIESLGLSFKKESLSPKDIQKIRKLYKC